MASRSGSSGPHQRPHDVADPSHLSGSFVMAVKPGAPQAVPTGRASTQPLHSATTSPRSPTHSPRGPTAQQRARAAAPATRSSRLPCRTAVVVNPLCGAGRQREAGTSSLTRGKAADEDVRATAREK
jgi:hypothetical protein